MTTRAEIIEAIRANDARVEALRAGIAERPEQPLLEGEWRVRDALSHVAARGNPVPRMLARLQQAARNPGNAPRLNIDEINHGQVEERRGAGTDELLSELAASHETAIRELEALDDELLASEIPFGYRPGMTTVGEMLRLAGPGHEANHLDTIDAALRAGSS